MVLDITLSSIQKNFFVQNMYQLDAVIYFVRLNMIVLSESITYLLEYNRKISKCHIPKRQ